MISKCIIHFVQAHLNMVCTQLWWRLDEICTNRGKKGVKNIKDFHCIKCKWPKSISYIQGTYCSKMCIVLRMVVELFTKM